MEEEEEEEDEFYEEEDTISFEISNDIKDVSKTIKYYLNNINNVKTFSFTFKGINNDFTFPFLKNTKFNHLIINNGFGLLNCGIQFKKSIKLLNFIQNKNIKLLKNIFLNSGTDDEDYDDHGNEIPKEKIEIISNGFMKLEFFNLIKETMNKKNMNTKSFIIGKINNIYFINQILKLFILNKVTTDLFIYYQGEKNDFNKSLQTLRKFNKKMNVKIYFI